MVKAVLTEITVEQVSPELLPTLATPSFDDRTVLGSAKVADGAAGWLAPAKSRMVPLVSTIPGTICAIAASTLLGVPWRVAACDICATVPVFCGRRFPSTYPG